MTTYYVMDVVFYLWYCYVKFIYYLLNLIVLVKSFVAFSRYDEKSDFPEVVSRRDMTGMRTVGSITG
jgi:hypothetical protein